MIKENKEEIDALNDQNAHLVEELNGKASNK